MAKKGLPGWATLLADVMPSVDEFLHERHVWLGAERARVTAALAIPDDYHANLSRMRAYASEAIVRWPPTDDLERFEQLVIVDAHDALVDAGAALLSGMGAPGIALLRRSYELGVLLTALWNDRDGTRHELEKALNSPRQHDNLANAAGLGVLGSVMPNLRRLRRHAGFDSAAALDDVEKGLASVGHGGMFASGFYLSDEPDDTPTIDGAGAFFEICTRVTGLSAATSSLITRRSGFERTHRYASMFDFAEIERREDLAMDAFEGTYPQACQVIWATCMGLRSLSAEVNDLLGARPYDDLRRQSLVLVDGVGTADLAFEMLHRGRLSAAATVTRRLFELAHEAQGWAERPDSMGNRGGGAPDDAERVYRTPAAGRMIDVLYESPFREMQKRTYSTLCSVAHGGLQAHAYLFDGPRPTPAPQFVARHHGWVLGTLAATLSQFLQSALIIAGRMDPDIGNGYTAYELLLRGWLEDMPILGLTGPGQS